MRNRKTPHTTTSPATDPQIPGKAVTPLTQTRLAYLDIAQGAGALHLWGVLGWHDVRLKYRRSKLGPFWLTISMGVLVGVLGTIYGSLLNAKNTDYVPYLALGFIFWSLISSLVNDAGSVFVRAQGIIKESDLPLSLHVYRVVWRNLIILAHNVVVFLIVAIIFSVWPSWVWILAAPGLVLVCITGMWVGLGLGLVSARFRDMPPIVGSVMRLSFFITPIIWMPEMWPHRTALLDFNPFYHYLEVVRAPLLGRTPALLSWFVVLGVTIVGSIVTFALFQRFRRRIAYWV